jgi:hypothetical protein
VTLSVRSACLALAIIGGGFFLSATDNWIYELKANHPKWYMAPFTNVTNKVRPDIDITNRVLDFIVPDSKIWFEKEYMDPWKDTHARANIWNFAGKTAMFGEFSYTGDFRKIYLAPFMNIVFIFLFVLMCYGLPMFWRFRLIPYGYLNEANIFRFAQIKYENNALRKGIRGRGRWLGAARANSLQGDFRFVGGVASFLVLLFLFSRINHAAPSITDFRYLMPIMPVIVAAIAGGIMRLQKYHWRFVFANALVLCFALASFLFYFGI